MDLFTSENTCSMAEVGFLTDQGGSENLEKELARRIEAATESNRKMLIANVSQEQMRSVLGKELRAALRTHGFKKVGAYFGNTDCDVHVYIRGLKTRSARVKK